MDFSFGPFHGSLGGRFQNWEFWRTCIEYEGEGIHLKGTYRELIGNPWCYGPRLDSLYAYMV